MDMQEGIMAFFSAVGMTTIVWLAVGLIFRPGRRGVPHLRLVLSLTGDAPAMEHDVRTLRRIQAQHPGALIVLEDRGLTPEGRALARYLAAREDHAVFVSKFTKDEGESTP
jgi:hypothetical protein